MCFAVVSTRPHHVTGADIVLHPPFESFLDAVNEAVALNTAKFTVIETDTMEYWWLSRGCSLYQPAIG